MDASPPRPVSIKRFISPRVKYNIERILAEDGKTTTGATSIAEVVARMRAIDLDGCPRDFSSAYFAHIHDWERFSDVERELAAFHQRYNSGGAMLESFLRGLIFDFGMVGEAAAAQQKLRTSDSSASGEERSSFQRVEQVVCLMGPHRGRKPIDTA
jgi:hypothetical protein